MAILFWDGYSETPTNEQQIITACAFLFKKEGSAYKVFLAKRAPAKKFLPGQYELIGGHIEYGEDIKVGLRREIQEELGIEATIGEPFAAFTYMNEVKGSQSIEVVYFASFNNGIRQPKINPEDHSECGWFAREQITTLATKIKPADNDEFLAIDRGFEILTKGFFSYSPVKLPFIAP